MGHLIVNTSFNTLFSDKNQYQYSGLGLQLIHKYIFKAVLSIDYGINLDGFKNASLVFGIDQFFKLEQVFCIDKVGIFRVHQGV